MNEAMVNSIAAMEVMALLAGIGFLVIVGSIVVFAGTLAVIVQEIIKADRHG